MSEEKKIKRKIVPNIGMIVFFVIIIYLLGYIMTYLERDKLAIYEVGQSDVKDTIEGTGIIFREEELISTNSTGYVSPYVKEGSRVKVGGTVYTIDTTGKIQEFINSIASEKDNTDEEEQKMIVKDLRSYVESYDDDRFSDVYNVKNDVMHDLQAYTDTIMAKNKDAFNEKYGQGSYMEQVSEKSGIVSFLSDGLEKKSIEKLTAEDFEGKNAMNDLRTMKKVAEKTPVYRMVTSQSWHVVMQLSQDEYLKLKDLERQDVTSLNIGFNKEEFTAKAAFSCYVKDSDYYIDLTFDQYVQRYMNQRYLWTRIILSEEEGLIVPTSAITFKEAYKISEKYLINQEDGNYVHVMDVNHDNKVTPIKVDIIKKKTTGTNINQKTDVYINSTQLNEGDMLTDAKQKESISLEKRVKVRGVFIVNQGYAAFAPVEVTQKTEDYSILSQSYSDIQMYDRIILHSDSIKENQIIY